MATVNLKSAGGGLGINVYTLQVVDLFDYDYATYSTTSFYIYDNLANFTRFTGFGFAGSYAGTQPNGTLTSVTGGTVQTVVYRTGNVDAIVVTGASASAATLFNSGRVNNTTVFINEMLKGNDTINGTPFADVLRGSTGLDTLNGFGGNDTLNGEAGNDTLRGGLGRDVLIGGTGGVVGTNNDIFDFDAVTDSGVSAATRDIVYDFTKGQDKIDLRGIDAIFGGADNAFSLLARDTSATHTGPVGTGKIGWYWEGQGTATTADDKTVLKLNTDADAIIESTIEIRGLINLSPAAGVDFFF